MPMTETLIEARRVTRVFFDCRDVAPTLDDQRRIAAAIETAIALAQDDDDEQDASYMPELTDPVMAEAA
jgi:hypothetical protein